MPNATAAKWTLAGINLILKPLQTSLCLYDRNTAFAIHCNAGGVIAAVLQLTQSVQQDINRIMLAYIAYNSTHIFNFPFCTYKC